jgi:hypothetical protein
MKSNPFIINIENISEKDLDIVLLDLTEERLMYQEFDELDNLIFDKKIKISCGNTYISMLDFLNFIIKDTIIITKIKIIASNNNQKHQGYSIVNTKDKLLTKIIPLTKNTDFVLDNTIQIKTGYFFKNTTITFLFYPKF